MPKSGGLMLKYCDYLIALGFVSHISLAFNFDNTVTSKDLIAHSLLRFLNKKEMKICHAQQYDYIKLLIFAMFLQLARPKSNI
jgi:hypothetical protein